MRIALVLSFLVLCATMALGQELPKTTPAGQKAVAELLERCVAAGAMARVGDPPQNDRLEVADATRLKETILAQRPLLTPELRDALIVQAADAPAARLPGLSALLSAIGEQTTDDLALGVSLYYQGRQAERDRAYADALRAYSTAAEHCLAARSLTWQAACENRTGVVHLFEERYDEALKCFERALAWRVEFAGPEHVDVAHSLNNLGVCYARLNQYDKALDYHLRALRIRERQPGDHSYFLIQSLSNLALAYYNSQDYAGALGHYQRLLALQQVELGDQHIDVASTLVNIANAHFSKARYSEAGEYYERALAMRKTLLGSEHSDVAWTLRALGELFSAQSQYERATAYYDQALAIFQKQGVQQGIAVLCDDLGNTFYQRNEFARAIAHYERALGLRKKLLGDEHAELADGLRRIGNSHYSAHQYAEARKYYEQALAMRRKLLGAQHAEVAVCLTDLGYVCNAEQDYPRALDFFEQALTMRKAVFKEAHGDVGWSLRNVGDAYYYLTQYEQAQEHYRQALDLFRKLGIDAGVAACLSDLGYVCERRSDFAQALDYYRQALEIRSRLYGEEHVEVASTLRSIGNVYHLAKQYGEARQYHQRALELRRKLLGEQHRDVADTLSDLGDVCYQEEDYAKASEYYEQALRIRQAIYGPEDPELAKSLRALGNVYFYQQKLPEALAQYTRALEIRQAAFGSEHAAVADVLADMGDLHKRAGRYGEALQYYQRARDMRRKILGAEHPDVAISLGLLGSAYQLDNQNDLAVEQYEKALLIRRKVFGAESAQVARTLNDIGYARLEQGEYGKALTLHQEALVILKARFGERSIELAWTLFEIGYCYDVIEEYGRAIDFYEQALALRNQFVGARHPEIVANRLAIARAYERLGLTSKAVEYFVKSLDDPDPERYPEETARIWMGRGTFWADLGLESYASEYYQKALDLTRKTKGDRHPDVALCLYAVGQNHRKLEQYEEALDVLGRALALRRETSGSRHPEVARTLWDIALVHGQRGEFAEALRVCNEALEILRRSRSDAPAAIEQASVEEFARLPLTAYLLRYRSWVFEEAQGPDATLGDWQAVARSYELAANLLDAVRGQLIETENSKLTFGADAATILAGRLRVCRRLHDLDGKPEHLVTAFAATEQGTARVFLESLGKSRAHAIGGVSEELRTKEAVLLKKWQQLEEQIHAERSLPLEKRNGERLAQFVAQQKEAEQDLAAIAGEVERRFPRYAALRHPQPCTLAEARACLADNEVALIYVMRSDHAYLLLVESPAAGEDAAAALALYELAPGSDIADVVGALTDSQALQQPVHAGSVRSEAYDMLLGPVADRIRGKDLVIVPSAALCYLPFELLAEPSDGRDQERRYLLENHRIRYAPSLTVLHMVREWERVRVRPGRALWAIGDPVYEASDERAAGANTLADASAEVMTEYAQRTSRGASPETLQYRRLRYSGEELRAIAKILGAGSSVVRVGTEATEAAVKAASERGELGLARYVHFACHGILGFDVGRQQSLVLSLVGNQQEDGFLQLDEVTNLKLNADVVVLSACSTAGGLLHNGEGVRGLARAFLYAGSRGVVCSLWSVDDRGTADLIQAMYGHLNDGQRAADALRAAKLQMIRAGQAPVYWAPFILMGE